MWFLVYVLLFSHSLGVVSLEPSRNRMVKQLIKDVHKQHRIPVEWLNQQFEGLQLNEASLNLMQRPFEAKPWHQYRQLLVSQKRVKGGREFIQKHKAVLGRYEAKYQIPASVVTAVIGIETSYGQNKGDFNVLEALSTLGLYYTPRSSYFRSEAVELLRYAFANQLSTKNIKGSYAGAVGIPQFMPSNIARYGRQHTQEGVVDLIGNTDDAIVSVFHYLSKHGRWQPNEPVMRKLQLSPDQANHLSKRMGEQRMLPVDRSLEHMLNLRHASKSWIIRLEHAPNQYHFYRVFRNFKSIMSYNNSVHYSSAVYQLSQSLTM
jgi:membrane-bound lytic murein transglycosylase B